VRRVDGARLLATPHATSWNQSQLLTVHVVDGATAAYNIPMAHWLGASAGGGGAMRAALEALVERHAVLLMTYEVAADGGFAQRVRSRVDAELPLLSEASAPSEDGATALEDMKRSLKGYGIVDEESSLRLRRKA